MSRLLVHSGIQALFFACVLLSPLSGIAEETRHNVLLIGVDDVRPGFLGAGTNERQRLKFDALPGLHTEVAQVLSPESIAASDERPENAETVSFENARTGVFDKLETEIGTWTPGDGKSIIDGQHAKTGQHCLQLTGGSKTSIILDVADDVDTSGELAFWAERWTKRTPFSFRIEKNSGDGWQEVFNGDKEVRVGRAFLSHVKVSLGDDNIQKLRFIVSSPPNTGILIDDIRLAPARPQEIVEVEVLPLTLPALVGTNASPLVKLRVTTSGTLEPISLTKLRGTVQSDESDVEEVQAYFTGGNSQFSSTVSFGKSQASNRAVNYSGLQVLEEGQNDIWLGCKLSENANIDHFVSGVISSVTFSNGQTFNLDAPRSEQRMGVSVRTGGDDGVHTYRIPGLATTNKGTLIGVYDVRHRSRGDLPGDIDVGMSRSTDGGRTWESMQVIMDMGDDPNWNYDGIGDPAILVDQNTGTIWVAATWSHGNRSWFGSGPGLKPEETGQLMLVRSDDDGVTWSKPINITEQVKNPEWSFLLQGPGKGITMQDGTIVFAAQYQDPPNASDRSAHRLPHSTILYSKDHGETWEIGTGAFDDTTEAQVAEVEPGVLMLNCRYNRKAVRVVMTSEDLGKTWQKHSTSERALIEPGSCMASLINVDQELGKDTGGWLLFSNPDSTRGRHHITIKASSDNGQTWPKENRLLLDDENSAGYSCMSMIDEKTVGILYEGSQAQMTFQRIPLSDVITKPKPVTLSKPTRKLQLPQVFSSHMVLQADAELPVWGQAEPNSKVLVTLGEQTKKTIADENGDWQVRFPPRRASSTPIQLEVACGDEKIQLTDILVGEVWVCAGQSNMEWTLSQSANGPHELSQASRPQLRLLHLKSGAQGSSGSYTQTQLARLTLKDFSKGEWKVAAAESAREFSAVGWYFGKNLQEQLDVPVGLICPAVGGTPTEAWIPREALEADPDLNKLVAGNWLDNNRLGNFCRSRGQQNLLVAIQAGEKIPSDDLGPNHPFKPGFMWESGIKPLIPFAIRGAIWYQGESNAENPARVREHGRLFPMLISQWRSGWKMGDFPFLYVQLPAMNRPDWPMFRDSQRRTLSQLENIGMAVTIDTGHPTNVHPTLKKPVGERLAMWALGTTYRSKSDIAYASPLVESTEREGDSIVLSFQHVGKGLKSSDGTPLRHFEIRSDHGKFRPADAKVLGKNSISVSSPDVPNPRYVRYAWSPYPVPPVNLVNSAGLPASPFTTESEATVAVEEANSETGP